MRMRKTNGKTHFPVIRSHWSDRNSRMARCLDGMVGEKKESNDCRRGYLIRQSYDTDSTTSAVDPVVSSGNREDKAWGLSASIDPILYLTVQCLHDATFAHCERRGDDLIDKLTTQSTSSPSVVPHCQLLVSPLTERHAFYALLSTVKWTIRTCMKPYILLQATRKNVSAQNTSSVRLSRVWATRLSPIVILFWSTSTSFTNANAPTELTSTLRLYVEDPLTWSAIVAFTTWWRECTLERKNDAWSRFCTVREDSILRRDTRTWDQEVNSVHSLFSLSYYCYLLVDPKSWMIACCVIIRLVNLNHRTDSVDEHQPNRSYLRSWKYNFCWLSLYLLLSSSFLSLRYFLAEVGTKGTVINVKWVWTLDSDQTRVLEAIACSRITTKCSRVCTILKAHYHPRHWSKWQIDHLLKRRISQIDFCSEVTNICGIELWCGRLIVMCRFPVQVPIRWCDWKFLDIFKAMAEALWICKDQREIILQRANKSIGENDEN